MQRGPIAAYFVILAALCAAFVIGARSMGSQGAYLAQGYMMTPAIAAVITRIFFYPKHFRDAKLRLGRIRDYFAYWGLGLAITAISFAIYTLTGSIRWDLSASAFLDRLAEQFALSGTDMLSSLPPGFTPQLMLVLFTIGGLTVFNVVPGLITGFGEEFGHRGFMFPQLYRIQPLVGLLGGGLIWFAWHLPLLLIMPGSSSDPPAIEALNLIVLALGSIAAFTYLAYVYVDSGSVFVTSIAHISMNNAAAALSYYVIVQNQFVANIGNTLSITLIVWLLYRSGRLKRFRQITESE